MSNTLGDRERTTGSLPPAEALQGRAVAILRRARDPTRQREVTPSTVERGSCASSALKHPPLASFAREEEPGDGERGETR